MELEHVTFATNKEDKGSDGSDNRLFPVWCGHLRKQICPDDHGVAVLTNERRLLVYHRTALYVCGLLLILFPRKPTSQTIPQHAIMAAYSGTFPDFYCLLRNLLSAQLLPVGAGLQEGSE